MVHHQLRFGKRRVKRGLIVRNSRGEKFRVTQFNERKWDMGKEEAIKITLKRVAKSLTNHSLGVENGYPFTTMRKYRKR